MQRYITGVGVVQNFIIINKDTFVTIRLGITKAHAQSLIFLMPYSCSLYSVLYSIYHSPSGAFAVDGLPLTRGMKRSE